MPRARTPMRRTRILVVLLWIVSFIVGPAGFIVVAGSGAAQAATIGVTIRAQVNEHHGTANSDSTNCIKYQPFLNATSTTWVGAGVMALTAHGYPGDGNCPGALSTAIQSAIGVMPASTTTVTDGVPFLLSSITHYNNPITAGVAARYTGNLALQLGGFDTTPTITYAWTMWETPNNASPCAFPDGPNTNGCADQTTFVSQVGPQVLTKNGIRYRLVMNGFAGQTGGTCPTTPAAGTTPGSDFLTAEGAVTTQCLYATLVQIRTLTVVKTATAPTGTALPGFAFTSQSNLTGSAWGAQSFTLTPPTAPGDRRSADLLQGETVTLTEGLPTDDRWALTGIRCVDGLGRAMTGVTVDLAAGTATLANVAAPDVAAAGPVTCTYTNTYTPKATLTLVKTVTGGSATVANFVLSANGSTPIAGVSGTAAVTGQRITAGTYTLSETASVNGYIAGAWSCTGATVTGSSVAIPDGATVTCSIQNRFATGTLRIVKAVQGPPGGYTGTNATPFSGTYTCGAAAPVPYTVSVGTPYVSGQIPAGTSCTVTETQPTGNLADTSYRWSAPAYNPVNAQVTIQDQQAATVTITNTYAQQTGSFALDKVILPRAGVEATGYAGGPSRSFPVSYVCRIGATVVASGSTAVTPDGSLTRVSGIPATAQCTFTETLTAQSGDFRDTSLRWDGNSWSPATVTITPDGIARATVTNYFARDFATLTVAKVVTGAGYVGTGTPFEVAWNCGLASGTVRIGPGTPASVQVPANTLCSISETPPAAGLLDPAHVWGPPTYAGLPAGGISIAPNGTATVTVTNPTVPIYGRVAVVKAVTPQDASTAVAGGARFALTVACNAPAEGDATNYTHTFSAALGTPETTPNLPVGTSCQVTEAPPSPSALLDDSYRWGPTPAAQSVTVLRDQVSTVTVTNQIVRAYGTLRIVKAINDPFGLPGAATTTFSGTWTCHYGDDPPLTGTWSRVGAGAATLTGPTGAILLGSSCTMTETSRTPSRPDSDSSYRWGAEQTPSPVTLTAAAPVGTLTVTNPVVRIVGGFAVSKVAVGGAAGSEFANAPFSFSYSCTPAGGGTALTGTLQVRDGQTVSVGQPIPAGAACQVTETASPAPIDPYRWTGTQIGIGQTPPTTRTSVDFTLPEDGSGVQVRVFNTIEPQSLTVSGRKVLTGQTQGFTDPTMTFDLSLVCTSRGATQIFGPVAGRVGENVSFAGIPLGATCTITEAAIPPGRGLADASYAWGPEIASPTIVVVDNTATFVKINPIVRVYGDVELTKALTDPDHVTDPARTYSGTLVCQHPGDPDLVGTWTINGAGPATLTFPGGAQPLLGSVCTPTEAALTAPPSATDSSYRWEPPTLTPATVVANATATAVVTNTVRRATGNLTVAVTVSGAVAGYTGGSVPHFIVDYSCYLGDPNNGALKGQVVVAAGTGPVTLAAGIPAGWTCEVAQVPPTADLLRNVSYQWGVPTYTGLTGGTVAIAEGTTSEIDVDNPITQRTGAIAIGKALATDTPAAALASGATFTGTYSCSYDPGQPDARTQTGTWRVSGTGPATLTPAIDLPVGTVCQVAEDAPTPATLVDTSWVWDPAGPTVSGTATVVGSSETPSVTVTNRAVRAYSALNVTKSYTGPATALPAGTTVTGTWTCAYRGAPVADGTWTLPATGGTAALFAADGSVLGRNGPILVPAESQCTVTEGTLDDAALTDASYTWGDPVYAPADGRVATASAAPATVTVTNSVQRVYRPLTITKVIAAPDGVTVLTGLTFSGRYECTHPGADQVSGAWQVRDQGSQNIQGILVGSTCRITSEDTLTSSPVGNDESYQWTTPVFSTTGVLVDRDHPAGLTVLNPVVRRFTDLTVSKAVAGNDVAALPAGLAYPMTYRCEAMNGDVTDGAFSLANGGSWTSPATIPVGARCTVTEGALPDVAPRSTWAPVTFAVTGILTNVPTVAGQSVSFDVPAGQADLSVAHPKVVVTNTINRVAMNWVVEKSADPPSGTRTLHPGDTITYKVVVTPHGEGAVDNVIVTDDLTAVLPYASFGAAQAPGATSATVAGNTLTWTIGRLTGQEPLTLTYTVIVKTDAWGATLTNGVTGTGDLPPDDCVKLLSCLTTTHGVVPAWTLTKTSDPVSGTIVSPGQQITYSLTVTNLSKVAPVGPVTVTDDLTGVLPYATIASVGPAPVGSAAVSGTNLVWQVPSVPAGGTVTLPVRIVVKPDAAGATIVNVVTGTSPIPEGPCPTCQTRVTHPVSQTWSMAKSADPPSGTKVLPGQRITYTVTVRAAGVLGASERKLTNLTVTDDLTQVVRYADVGEVKASVGTAAVAGNALTWNIPELPVGAVVTVTYVATVRPDVAGVTIRNHVTGTGTTPPDQCVTCVTEHPVPTPDLPVTGRDVAGLVRGGAVVLFAGAFLTVAARLRRRQA